MINLHDVVTAWLSGITTTKREGIIWQDAHGAEVVIKLIDAETERYRVRYYAKKGGAVRIETYYKGNLKDGRETIRRNNGTKESEIDFVNGVFDGLRIKYSKSGGKICEEVFKKGILITRNF